MTCKTCYNMNNDAQKEMLMKTHLKHFGFGALLLLAMLLFFVPGAHAQERSEASCVPDAEML